MVDGRRFGAEGRKCVYTKRWRIEDRNNPVTSWYTSSRTWREIENNRADNKKLLVAKSNKRCWKIYGRMCYMSKNEK